MNLLANASHAIDQQGIIRITTKVRAKEVEVASSDNGCGIPAEMVSRIFKSFFTTKDFGKGTGLGLSINYDINKKNQGQLKVSSEPGQATYSPSSCHCARRIRMKSWPKRT